MSQIRPMLDKQKTDQKKKQEQEQKRILEEKKKLYEKYASMYSSYPLIHIAPKDQILSSKMFRNDSSISGMNSIQSIQVYIPGYLRLKFKNFNSFNLEEYYAEYNAAMIFTIYYGAVLEHLTEKYGLQSKDQEKIIGSLQNELIMTLCNEESIQLSEQMEVQEKKSDLNKKIEEQPKPIVNSSIQTTVRLDKSKKFIHYTIRKNFKVNLESHVFLTPFERINTILDISVQPLTIEINGENSDSKIPITFHLNLLNSIEQKSDKILITEAKKFGKYGLILPELDAFYYSKESDLVGHSNDKLKNQENEVKRLKSEIKKVFSQKSCIPLRQSYREYAEKYRGRYQLLCPQMDDEEKQYLQSSERNPHRRFFIKQISEPFQSFSQARFLIPLYKFPFTSIATIFFPMWLLAVLNLGIFFQDQSLGGRIASVASLMIAFIAFIPTIRQQIPPSPKIVLIEIVVYAVTMTTLLALFQSLWMVYADETQLAERDKLADPYFLTSLVLDILSFLIVVIFTILHYGIWQKRYKTEDKNPEKKQLYKERWHNHLCEQQVTKKFNFSKKFVYNDSKDKNNEKKLQKGDQHGIFEITPKKFNKVDHHERTPYEQQSSQIVLMKTHSFLE